MSMDTIRTLDFLLAGVLMPRGCCGCSRPDAVLCPQCAVLFSGEHSRALPSVALGQTYACAQYSGRVRHAIVGWKDHGDCECDGVFAQALVELTRKIHLTDALAGRTLLVVPAPSSRRSIRRRGRWHMRDLARRYVALLRLQGVDARVGTVLAMPSVRSKAVEHSGRQQRSSRASGVQVVRPEVLRGVGGVDAATSSSMTGVQDSETLRGVSVVLLDDIVTTGATMRSCVRALLGAGADVITCLALAQVDASSPVQVDVNHSIRTGLHHSNHAAGERPCGVDDGRSFELSVSADDGHLIPPRGASG